MARQGAVGLIAGRGRDGRAAARSGVGVDQAGHQQVRRPFQHYGSAA